MQCVINNINQFLGYQLKFKSTLCEKFIKSVKLKMSKRQLKIYFNYNASMMYKAT